MSTLTAYPPTPPAPAALPPDHRVRMRSHLRHPQEIVSLGVVLLASLALWGSAVANVWSAIDQETELDSYSTLLIAMPLVVYLLRGQLHAQQRLSGVKLSPTQYPEAYRMVGEASAYFGLPEVPDAYVVLGNGMINAAASGHGRRRYIFIYSDLFEIGGAARDPEALRFIIGHEVGHIAAGHTSYWRSLGVSGGSLVPLLGSVLSRSQEYTADNFGHAFAPQGSAPAMATLSAGKYLNRSVDVNALADRAVTERGFFVWTVNALASHPVLAWRSHALRDRRRPGRLLWRPKHLL